MFPFPIIPFIWSTLSVFARSYFSKRLSSSLILSKRPFSQGGANSMAHDCGNFCYALRWMKYYPFFPVIPPTR